MTTETNCSTCEKCGSMPKNHDDKPDHELLVWEKWVTIRKEETEMLARRTDRVPADLVMNLLEKQHADKERKTALEYAQIEKKPKLRGGIWEQPERLTQTCPCAPVFEVHRKPAEKGNPPVVVHVGVPHEIQVNEKGLAEVSMMSEWDPSAVATRRNSCHLLDREYKEYRLKRENELKEKLQKIDPHRSDIDALYIRGRRPRTPPPKPPDLPDIKITEASEISSTLTAIYAIRINNTVFYKQMHGQDVSHLRKMHATNWHENCTTWNYYFNVPIKRVGRSKMVLHNYGTVALKYCWRRIKLALPFIPVEAYCQVFFFNKNEDVIPPGQTRTIYFTFVSEAPGTYSESFELIFSNVCFFDKLEDKLTLNLAGDALDNVEKIIKKVDKLKGKIHRKAIHNIVKSILDEIVDSAPVLRPEFDSYKKLFLEGQFFIMKNPVCFYHQTEVHNMKEWYSEMTAGESWDLSVATWRDVMKDKVFDERMRYYDILKATYSKLLKPWREGDDHLVYKRRYVRMLVGIMADKFDATYRRLFEINDREQEGSPAVSSLQGMKSASNNDLYEYQGVRNVFYLKARDHVADMLEAAAGLLTSADTYRWINFYFCQL